MPPLVVYNLLLMASVVACGLATTALGVHLTGSRSAGIVAGCLFALAPYRLEQLAHLQILANWWGPVALLALHRQADAGGWRWAWLFAVSWLLLALTSGYHLLFFTVVAGLAIVWGFGFSKWGTKRTLRQRRESKQLNELHEKLERREAEERADDRDRQDRSF